MFFELFNASFQICRNPGNAPVPSLIQLSAGNQDSLVGNALNKTYDLPANYSNEDEIANISSLSVFHALSEYFKVGKDILKATQSPLKVYFNSLDAAGKEMGSHCYFGGTPTDSSRWGKGLYIRLQDRFDWDVIGHEYSHYLLRENSVLNSIGGRHAGTNQFVYPLETTTHLNKEMAIQLAFSEGFATFMSVVLQKHFLSYKNSSPANYFALPNVGDDSYSNTEDSRPTIRAYP